MCKICENTESSDEDSDDTDDEAIREALKRNQERQEKQKKLELEALERNRILEEERLERNKRLEEEVKNVLAHTDSSDDDVVYVARVPKAAKILNAFGEPLTVVTLPLLRCADAANAPPHQRSLFAPRNQSVGSHLPFNIKARTAKFMPRKTAPLAEHNVQDDDDRQSNADKDEQIENMDVVTLESDDEELDTINTVPSCEIGEVFSGKETKLMIDGAASDDEDIIVVEEVASKRERTLQEILEELAKPS